MARNSLGCSGSLKTWASIDYNITRFALAQAPSVPGFSCNTSKLLNVFMAFDGSQLGLRNFKLRYALKQLDSILLKTLVEDFENKAAVVLPSFTLASTSGRISKMRSETLYTNTEIAAWLP